MGELTYDLTVTDEEKTWICNLLLLRLIIVVFVKTTALITELPGGIYQDKLYTYKTQRTSYLLFSCLEVSEFFFKKAQTSVHLHSTTVRTNHLEVWDECSSTLSKSISKVVFYFCFSLWDSSHYVVQSGFALVSSLCQSPECCDSKCISVAGTQVVQTALESWSFSRYFPSAGAVGLSHTGLQSCQFPEIFHFSKHQHLPVSDNLKLGLSAPFSSCPTI